MKMKLVAAALGVAMSTSYAASDSSSLKTNLDKLSYSIGVDLGTNFKKQNIEVSPAALASGVNAGLGKEALKLTDAQMKEVLSNFQKELMAKRSEEVNKIAEKNKAEGEAFLTKNKGNAGVKTLPSGLQYKVIKSGTGAKPTKSDTVTVEYTGRLLNGEVFDSTEKSGKPATFKLTQVIPGWTEALQLMPAGSEWEIFIPSNLAYGKRSVGGPIGPNETLIFKINLLSVQTADS